MATKSGKGKKAKSKKAKSKKAKPTGGKSERERDAQRKRVARQQERIVEVEVSVVSLQRRKRLEKDIFKWLRYYFGFEFTAQQKTMVKAILSAARYGGDQALAAPRGEGKTTVAELVVIYCVLTGILSFPVIFSATGPEAERILSNIKEEFEENERLLVDYNEVCGPIRALEGMPNRAAGQWVAGHIGKEEFPKTRSKMRWSGRYVRLPALPGKHSRATGAIIATRGLDSAVRGMKVGRRRPDLAVIDDPETREIAESETQPDKLERKIDQDLAGLAGQGKRLARVMLTTLMNRRCLSYKYTDRKQKPSWKGRRLRLMATKPEREDLWEEYVILRQRGQQEDDEFARIAHKFYRKNRKRMDAAAVMTNLKRHATEKTPDGSPLQLSTLQYYYDLVADIGEMAVLTEYQNDPPEETGPVESGVTAHLIQCKTNGYPRKIVPPGCTKLTQGIDVRKIALHWVVRAWRPDGTGFTIDRGVQEVHGTIRGSDEGLELALVRAVRARADDMAGAYSTVDKKPIEVNRTLVDAAWQTQAIYHACRELGLGWDPAMGFGKSAGCVQAHFNAPVRNTRDKKAGDGWFLSRKPKRVWLVCCETDRWKSFEHARWLTPENKPGSMSIWGEVPADGARLSLDQRDHFAYAKHLTAEVEVEEPIRGVMVRRWRNKHDNNHWFDASYLSCIAAAMEGISVLAAGAAADPQAEAKAKGWFESQKRRGRSR